jgi:hypothetical protein
MPSHHISHQPGIWLIQSLLVWWGRLSILKPCYGISSCRAWTCHGNFKQSFFLLATSHLLDVQSLDLYNQEACRTGRECAITHLPQVLCISLMGSLSLIFPLNSACVKLNCVLSCTMDTVYSSFGEGQNSLWRWQPYPKLLVSGRELYPLSIWSDAAVVLW